MCYKEVSIKKKLMYTAKVIMELIFLASVAFRKKATFPFENKTSSFILCTVRVVKDV